MLEKTKKDLVKSLYEAVNGLPLQLADIIIDCIKAIENKQYDSWEELLKDQDEVYNIIQEVWVVAIRNKANRIMDTINQ